jgi:hypothetical protein
MLYSFKIYVQEDVKYNTVKALNSHVQCTGTYEVRLSLLLTSMYEYVVHTMYMYV